MDKNAISKIKNLFKESARRTNDIIKYNQRQGTPIVINLPEGLENYYDGEIMFLSKKDVVEIFKILKEK